VDLTAVEGTWQKNNYPFKLQTVHITRRKANVLRTGERQPTSTFNGKNGRWPKKNRPHRKKPLTRGLHVTHFTLRLRGRKGAPASDEVGRKKGNRPEQNHTERLSPKKATDSTGRRAKKKSARRHPEEKVRRLGTGGAGGFRLGKACKKPGDKEKPTEENFSQGAVLGLTGSAGFLTCAGRRRKN